MNSGEFRCWFHTAAPTQCCQGKDPGALLTPNDAESPCRRGCDLREAEWDRANTTGGRWREDLFSSPRTQYKTFFSTKSTVKFLKDNFPNVHKTQYSLHSASTTLPAQFSLITVQN
eukprot:233661-Rhodomonas_salina.3